MKLKANDTLHISSVKAENLQPGEEFKVEASVGKSLVARGLATEVEGDDEPEEKAEPAPKNKAEKAPLNKSTAGLAPKAD